MAEKITAVFVPAEEKPEDQAANETFRQWLKRSTLLDWIQELLYFSLLSIVYGGVLCGALIFS
ncbi:MAG TPA: hypothetical protein ENG78_05280 [Acidiferrobacteraceae bacterium]|nr:hypothetical protein [Acidiferrobacteraceae bacterium]HEX20213.1 hypothetical protein [Acidiferrobacteraceae bacterium]